MVEVRITNTMQTNEKDDVTATELPVAYHRQIHSLKLLLSSALRTPALEGSVIGIVRRKRNEKKFSKQSIFVDSGSFKNIENSSIIFYK